MNFKTGSDAEKANLNRHSHWLQNTAENRKYLTDTFNQIMLNPDRRTIFVKNDTGMIAIYVDNYARKTGKESPRTRQISKSGKFMSIRHLAETLFIKNPDLQLATFKIRMQEEYPGTAPTGDKAYGHWCWYRFHIVIKGDLRYIPKPQKSKNLILP